MWCGSALASSRAARRHVIEVSRPELDGSALNIPSFLSSASVIQEEYEFAIALLLVMFSVAPLAAQDDSEQQVRTVIQQFHAALEKRDVSGIERLVAADLVALENGHRNDGWQDFRDNHLLPEFAEPMPPGKWEFAKVRATPHMGWGYTKQLMTVSRKPGEQRQVLLWSVYVLERRENTWKIVLLDWSIRTLRP